MSTIHVDAYETLGRRVAETVTNRLLRDRAYARAEAYADAQCRAWGLRIVDVDHRCLGDDQGCEVRIRDGEQVLIDWTEDSGNGDFTVIPGWQQNWCLDEYPGGISMEVSDVIKARFPVDERYLPLHIEEGCWGPEHWLKTHELPVPEGVDFDPPTAVIDALLLEDPAVRRVTGHVTRDVNAYGRRNDLWAEES